MSKNCWHDTTVHLTAYKIWRDWVFGVAKIWTFSKAFSCFLSTHDFVEEENQSHCFVIDVMKGHGFGWTRIRTLKQQEQWRHFKFLKTSRKKSSVNVPKYASVLHSATFDNSGNEIGLHNYRENYWKVLKSAPSALPSRPFAQFESGMRALSTRRSCYFAPLLH